MNEEEKRIKIKIELEHMQKINNEYKKEIEQNEWCKQNDYEDIDEWCKQNDYEDIDEYFLKRDISLHRYNLSKEEKNYQKKKIKEKEEKRKIEERKKLPDYKKGKLDPHSSVGFAFISQRVVSKTLDLELKYDCNCEINFGAPIDLYDKFKYDKINVKASILNKNNGWTFDLNQKFIPEFYICVAFSQDKKDVLYVWIIKYDSDIISEKNRFIITNSNKILKKWKHYEVDVRPYNYTYHRMSLENCSVLKK